MGLRAARAGGNESGSEPTGKHPEPRRAGEAEDSGHGNGNGNRAGEHRAGGSAHSPVLTRGAARPPPGFVPMAPSASRPTAAG